MKIIKSILYILFALSVLSACSHRTQIITLHAGAGLRDATDKLIQVFETENPDIKINANYAGSGRLLGQIITGNLGGLFMPGDVFYVNKAIEKNVAIKNTKRTVAYFIPVIFVQKNNPKNIHTLNDFKKNNLRIGLGDERTAAIGKRSLKIFEKNNVSYDKIKNQIVVKTGTVNELGVAISTKTVDAVILWDAIARQFAYAGDVVTIPEQQNIISEVPVILLKSTIEKKAAKQFIDFCTSKIGKKILKEKGYTIEIKK